MTRRVLGAVLTLALVVTGAVYLLKVTAIEGVGVSAISPNDVLAASGLRGGERILWMRTGRVAARIEAFPSVASVEVQRTLPGTIVIRVTERTAMVLLGRGLAADANGIVFGYPRTTGIPGLVGWRAPARPGAVLDGGSRAGLAALPSFPADLRGRIKTISLVGTVTMVLIDGTQIRFGQPTDLIDKARAAASVLADAARRHEVLAYVDVRAPTVPAAADRVPPTPSPGTSPGASPSASTHP